MGVASTTPIPFAAEVEKPVQPAELLAPGRGSIIAQEKTPTVTELTPASFISRTSSAHTSSGHCSGL